MNVKIECLREPKLVFGGGRTGLEPRRVMTGAGPVDGGRMFEVRLALVGPQADVVVARQWLARLNQFMAAREGNSQRYRDWPGAGRALGVQFLIEDRLVRPVDQTRFEQAMQNKVPNATFEELLDLFDGRIQGLLGDGGPDCIVVCCRSRLPICGLRIPG
jgi:hypothetical protein